MEAKLRDLLVGAGIGHIVMPRKQFVKEHKNLLGVLKRGNRSELNAEYADQAKELEAHGGTRNSGFIQRMLGEVKKVHKGAYRPITALHKDSTMSAPRVFSYGKVKTPSGWLQTKFGKAKAPADSADPFGGMTTQQIKDELHTLMGRADKVGNKNTPKEFNTTEKIKAEVLRLREAKAPEPAMKKPDMALLGQYHHAKKTGKNKPAIAQFEKLYHDWLLVNDKEYRDAHNMSDIAKQNKARRDREFTEARYIQPYRRTIENIKYYGSPENWKRLTSKERPSFYQQIHDLDYIQKQVPEVGANPYPNADSLPYVEMRRAYKMWLKKHNLSDK